MEESISSDGDKNSAGGRAFLIHPGRIDCFPRARGHDGRPEATAAGGGQ